MKNLSEQAGLLSKKKKMQEKLHAFMKQQGDKGIATEMAATSRQLKGASGD
ncbi:hypothetical protein [Niabella hibiscisoli]|uniref:hypothetical protein n=1 Tax=Niabella hibiscisoli TaxID=1825928 RepID=UPI001F0F70D5|nr:hypothetical protein [Niabella hibiscisoli]MCH5719484.1 hypothetical protein [Niabella hibiscisoli]